MHVIMKLVVMYEVRSNIESTNQRVLHTDADEGATHGSEYEEFRSQSRSVDVGHWHGGFERGPTSERKGKGLCNLKWT